jgi:peptidoglycan/LPS O-acetylase OafA/YrhL
MRGEPVLSDVLDSERNSFNLVRLVAALAVLISHSFSLQTGLGSSEPLAASTPFTLGQHAVNAFFVISGLTLSHSLQRSPNLAQYAWARFLRIFPPLFAFGLFFAFVVGPLLTSLRWVDYFTDAHTWLYPVAVLVQFARAVPPHEIFSSGPYAEVANEPLWTIKYEIAAYIGLAIFFRFGILNRTFSLFLALAVALGIFVLAAPSLDGQGGVYWLYQLGRYGFCFLLGVIAYHFRERLSLSPLLLILPATLVLLLAGTKLAAAGYVIFVAHMVLVAGARSYGALTSFSRKSDLSYGTYIYGWPVQQSLIALVPGIGVAPLLLFSLAIVPLFALASWNLVEKPALRLKRLDPRTSLPRFRPAA